ncbi:hypothetical protein RAS1_31550 [Phycisphaerae bacterium RAS1]|nr:hypothetical protein RAS1_31550 [Phycisphaerae bacterium RAS1]
MSSASLTRGPVRRGLTIIDLITWLIVLAILISILLPSFSRARELAKRAVCASNLQGIGQALAIYANDNHERFPQHYYEALAGAGVPGDHGVTWVGTMGSSSTLSITDATSPSRSPRAGHPSRSLFLLVTAGMATPQMFVCPRSGDLEDNLRNDSTGGSVGCQPGVTRFDFKGYNSLSYGYQMPFGPAAKPTTKLDVRMVIAADKGPYYTSGGDGLDGTRTTRDARSPSQPPADWTSRPLNDLLALNPGEWRRYNSRNHDTEGQNILFVDAHVDFAKKPIYGVNNDNIYTLQDSADDLRRALIGMVPTATQTLGPGVETDSFIVP